MRISELTQKGQVTEWLSKASQFIALDLETTGLTKNDKILSVALTGEDDQHVCFFGPELLQELLTARDGTVFVGHNIGFDLKFLAWHGVALHNVYDYQDTMILAHLCDENQEMGLGSLVLKYFKDNYKEEFWTKFKKAQDADKDSLMQYNAKDVHYTLKLYNKLESEFKAQDLPQSLLDHVKRLHLSLLNTEIDGIKIDIDYLMQKGTEISTHINQLVPQMREMVATEIEILECEEWMKEIDKRKTPKGKAGVKKPEFSFDSPKQLLDLLYFKLNLTPKYADGTKNLTTNYEALNSLKEEHPIVPMILDYREKQKIYGTYIEGTLEKIVDGRIYPSFNVTGTSTGRISHSNPNLGNMPREGGIRGMFVPDNGHVFISADFSQLEVRLSAHFTQDENLLKIVNEGASQHDITAQSLGIPRQLAKTVNFGMQYGCSHYKVAKVLGVNENEGKKAYDKYWETYSGQKRVMDECAAKVDRGESIISPFGRRRRFEVCKRKAWDSAYRQAWNALVQGTGSDCTSRAFYLADRALRTRAIGRALFTVHDEIVITAKEEHVKEAEQILLDCMKEVGQELNLIVPLVAESSGEMNKWED